MPNTTYAEAARIMVEKNFSGLPVVDAAGLLVGIVSEKDLFRALYANHADYFTNPELYADAEAREKEIAGISSTKVEEYMVRQVITVGPDVPVMRAGGMMLAYGVHRLPVVEDGRMIGIVTREEIYGGILRQHLNANYTLGSRDRAVNCSSGTVTRNNSPSVRLIVNGLKRGGRK